MEHRLIGKVLPIKLQGALDKFHHGIQDNSSRSVNKTGNLHLCKFRLHIGGIALQVSCDHGKIPVGKPLLPDQTADLQPGLMHLIPGSGGLKDTDFRLLLLTGFHQVAEQITFQVTQSRSVLKAAAAASHNVASPGKLPAPPGQRLSVFFRLSRSHSTLPLFLPGSLQSRGTPCLFLQGSGTVRLSRQHKTIPGSRHPGLLRQPAQVRRRLFAQMEQPLLSVQLIGVFSLSADQRYNHFSADQHQLLNDPVLNRSKTGKTVEDHHAARKQTGFFQRAAQHIQRLLRGDEIPPYVFLKPFIQHFQVLQLLYQSASFFGVGNQL